MRIGIHLRTMGPQSTRATILECARAAEDAGLDDLWVGDHIAIPPDDAEGSGGRYLDPLATLAFLAGTTKRIGIGTSVLVVPYRPPLATAKWVATIQELSEGRLHLGVGSGWMRAEFRAAGVEWQRRGAITDATLEFLQRCFANEVIESNGQPFLFKPRPKRPPIFVGGAPPHALRRTVRFGDGWMPHAADPQSLKPSIDELNQQMADAGRGKAEVAVLTTLPFADPSRVEELVHAFRDVGATRLIHGWRYRDAAEFVEVVNKMASIAA